MIFNEKDALLKSFTKSASEGNLICSSIPLVGLVQRNTQKCDGGFRFYIVFDSDYEKAVYMIRILQWEILAI